MINCKKKRETAHLVHLRARHQNTVCNLNVPSLPPVTIRTTIMTSPHKKSNIPKEKTPLENPQLLPHPTVYRGQEHRRLRHRQPPLEAALPGGPTETGPQTRPLEPGGGGTHAGLQAAPRCSCAGRRASQALEAPVHWRTHVPLPHEASRTRLAAELVCPTSAVASALRSRPFVSTMAPRQQDRVCLAGLVHGLAGATPVYPASLTPPHAPSSRGRGRREGRPRRTGWANRLYLAVLQAQL